MNLSAALITLQSFIQIILFYSAPVLLQIFSNRGDAISTERNVKMDIGFIFINTVSTAFVILSEIFGLRQSYHLNAWIVSRPAANG